VRARRPYLFKNAVTGLGLLSETIFCNTPAIDSQFIQVTV
jgi:hypothetical protein